MTVSNVPTVSDVTTVSRSREYEPLELCSEIKRTSICCIAFGVFASFMVGLAGVEVCVAKYDKESAEKQCLKRVGIVALAVLIVFALGLVLCNVKLCCDHVRQKRMAQQREGSNTPLLL